MRRLFIWRFVRAWSRWKTTALQESQRYRSGMTCPYWSFFSHDGCFDLHLLYQSAVLIALHLHAAIGAARNDNLGEGTQHECLHHDSSPQLSPRSK